MPLFLKHKILFIHIPKTAGSSVYEVFSKAGDEPIFTTGKINGHTAHHSTYKEHLDYRMVPKDFRVVAIWRDPIDRFVDEYNYFKTGDTLDQFIDKFFKGQGDWDTHDKPSMEFVEGCPKVEWVQFNNLEEDFKKVVGLNMNVHENPSEQLITEKDLTEEHLNTIKKFWAKDFK